MDFETFIRKKLPGYQNLEFTIPFNPTQTEFGVNTVITGYNQIENRIYLLNEGLIQVSTLKGEEERILEFVFPGEFFCAYTSFLLQQPADVQVMALAPCKVTVIDKDELIQASKMSLLANHLSLHIAQQMFLSRARREKDFLTLSAEERYLFLLERDPAIIQHLPGNKIAKYLGIQAESLSRIRKSIIS